LTSAKVDDTRQGSPNVARALEALTVLLVILVSPLSVLISFPLGISPESWLSVWMRYVFIFVVLAVTVALTGFGAASHYRFLTKKSRGSGGRS